MNDCSSKVGHDFRKKWFKSMMTKNMVTVFLKEKMKEPVLDKSLPWEDLFKDKTR